MRLLLSWYSCCMYACVSCRICRLNVSEWGFWATILVFRWLCFVKNTLTSLSSPCRPFLQCGDEEGNSCAGGLNWKWLGCGKESLFQFAVKQDTFRLCLGYINPQLLSSLFCYIKYTSSSYAESKAVDGYIFGFIHRRIWRSWSGCVWKCICVWGLVNLISTDRIDLPCIYTWDDDRNGVSVKVVRTKKG